MPARPRPTPARSRDADAPRAEATPRPTAALLAGRLVLRHARRPARVRDARRRDRLEELARGVVAQQLPAEPRNRDLLFRNLRGRNVRRAGGRPPVDLVLRIHGAIGLAQPGLPYAH